ncbi:MAG TPA: hypothetical protein VK674_04855 [Candidatus Limnocylindria bacterium]|nr:hypothetical protein [Candidatus Limnocylindria bacterium]
MNLPSGEADWNPGELADRNLLNLGIWKRARELVEDSRQRRIPGSRVVGEIDLHGSMSAESSDYFDDQNRGHQFSIDVEPVSVPLLQAARLYAGLQPPRDPNRYMDATLVDSVVIAGLPIRVAREYHLLEGGTLDKTVSIADPRAEEVYKYDDIGLAERRSLMDELNGIDGIY